MLNIVLGLMMRANKIGYLNVNATLNDVICSVVAHSNGTKILVIELPVPFNTFQIISRLYLLVA